MMDDTKKEQSLEMVWNRKTENQKISNVKHGAPCLNSHIFIRCSVFGIVGVSDSAMGTKTKSRSCINKWGTSEDQLTNHSQITEITEKSPNLTKQHLKFFGKISKPVEDIVHLWCSRLACSGEKVKRWKGEANARQFVNINIVTLNSKKNSKTHHQRSIQTKVETDQPPPHPNQWPVDLDVDQASVPMVPSTDESAEKAGAQSFQPSAQVIFNTLEVRQKALYIF